MKGHNGLDYVEVLDDQITLHAYFLANFRPSWRKTNQGLRNTCVLKADNGSLTSRLRMSIRLSIPIRSATTLL
jgi:hypothetical protein